MWAVQDSRVTSKHLKDYGTCFPEKIQFAEEQPITSKAKSPPRISRLPDVLRGQSLCYKSQQEVRLSSDFQKDQGGSLDVRLTSLSVPHGPDDSTH